MIIALDYDSTYSLDPIFWNKFIKLIKQFGHEVFICTMRYSEGIEAEEIIPIFKKVDIPIVFCSRRWKKNVCEELGIKVDVWIDDVPAVIQDQRDLIILDYTNNQEVHIWDWLSK